MNSSNQKNYKTYAILIMVLFLLVVALMIIQKTSQDSSQNFAEDLEVQVIDEEFDPDQANLEVVEGEMISGFPEYIEYPGSEVIRSTKSINEGEVVYQAEILTTEAETDEILDLYESEMQDPDFYDVVRTENEIRANRDPFSYSYNLTSQENRNLIVLEIVFDPTKTLQDDD